MVVVWCWSGAGLVLLAFMSRHLSGYPYLQVSILFMDIVGFTSMSKEVAPQMVMEFLNALFSKFDEICDDYDVYKVSREQLLTV